jgi:hypothetical protein
MEDNKSLVVESGDGLEGDPISIKAEKKVDAKYWCRDCGNQFTAPLLAKGELRSSGRGNVGFIKSNCPNCGSSNTSPHVRPGTVIISSLDGQPTVKHYVEAIKYAEGQGTSPKTSKLTGLRKLLGGSGK